MRDASSRSSDSRLWSLAPTAHVLPSRVSPMTDFRQRTWPQRIQRRYRPGFSPGSLFIPPNLSSEGTLELFSFKKYLGENKKSRRKNSITLSLRLLVGTNTITYICEGLIFNKLPQRLFLVNPPCVYFHNEEP
ncbi:hypothetical protein SDC9_61694 [bioreactor metagenome]|uniref:Uncharacterized protein n=1 Tax=bioreactor metagenome TaxID=1076179 RepID=A0A644XGF6_9ZZZZ